MRAHTRIYTYTRGEHMRVCACVGWVRPASERRNRASTVRRRRRWRFALFGEESATVLPFRKLPTDGTRTSERAQASVRHDRVKQRFLARKGDSPRREPHAQLTTGRGVSTPAGLDTSQLCGHLACCYRMVDDPDTPDRPNERPNEGNDGDRSAICCRDAPS